MTTTSKHEKALNEVVAIWKMLKYNNDRGIKATDKKIVKTALCHTNACIGLMKKAAERGLK